MSPNRLSFLITKNYLSQLFGLKKNFYFYIETIQYKLIIIHDLMGLN